MPSSIRERLRRVVDSSRFEQTIIVLIVINAVTLGLETSERAMASAGALIVLIDRLILAVFVVEIGLRSMSGNSASSAIRGASST